MVVFGATGFTGRLVVGYLAAHAPAGIRDSPQHGRGGGHRSTVFLMVSPKTYYFR